VKILGTTPETIDLAEDRDRFRHVMERLGIPQPQSGMAKNVEEALQIAGQIGYPLMVRPSYVLGGRAMEVVHDEEMLRRYLEAAVEVTPERPILIDKFLENAIEAEADAISDGTDAFVPAVQKQGLKYRIEETNNFFNGGAKDVSNTFASALWALDYLYWWADHNARGVNFHTGDKVAAGEDQAPCWYATFHTVPGGYHALPIAYAIKAFDLGSHGRLLPTTVSPGAADLAAYAVLGDDNTLFITLVNKGASAIDVSIATPSLQARPTAMFLTAPGSNVTAIDGVTLGNSSISLDGNWAGHWTAVSASKRAVALKIGPSSAAVVKLRLKSSPATHRPEVLR
jgi:hypothetical protein